MQVTKESIEKYLNGYLDSLKRVRQIETSIEELKYKLIPSGIDTTKTKVMCSYNDRISTLTAEIDRLQQQFDKEKSKTDRLKKRIYTDIIRAYPDKKIPYRKVLILRYLQGKTISNIANTLGYTDRHIIRLKKQALDCLVEIKNKQTEKG